MVRIEEQVYIQRPLAQVFAFLGDIANHQMFCGAFSCTRSLTESPLGLGSRVQKVSSFLGQDMVVEQEVVGYEPEHLIRFRVVSGPVRGEEEYYFADSGGGTLVTIRLASVPQGLLKFTARLLKSRIQVQLREDLRHLKSMLESAA